MHKPSSSFVDPVSLALPWGGCDSHAHIDNPKFDADREQVLARAKAVGLATIINVFMHPTLWQERRSYFSHHPEVFFALGIHPRHGQQCTSAVLEAMRQAFATDTRLVALGEIGLDFYRDDCPKEYQYQALRMQIRLAIELDKPVLIHCRQAETETLMMLESLGMVHKPLLWHCFTGNAAFAKRLVRNGWHLSIPGPVSYPANQELRDALAAIPLERLLLETDCPYLTPLPWRGTRNEPAYSVATVRHMATALQMPPEELWQRCGENARRFFAL